MIFLPSYSVDVILHVCAAMYQFKTSCWQQHSWVKPSAWMKITGNQSWTLSRRSSFHYAKRLIMRSQLGFALGLVHWNINRWHLAKQYNKIMILCWDLPPQTHLLLRVNINSLQAVAQTAALSHDKLKTSLLPRDPRNYMGMFFGDK